ncbi:DUF4011 domain-containing protein [Saxibacter everestensis]|uniref:DUF4011 domain-containing protein n=1 Tax=Saxibacter everestensis TaxID=2909229 RepID=A0ABY8QUG7_9MICO|nr:DUF4011 domain-containing protein [Brevibacteriaceae bacterium ZFBP1038]
MSDHQPDQPESTSATPDHATRAGEPRIAVAPSAVPGAGKLSSDAEGGGAHADAAARGGQPADDDAVDAIAAGRAVPGGSGGSGPGDVGLDPNSLDEAFGRWSEQVGNLGGRDTLLNYRDSREGTIDLTQAHPSGLAQLLAGRATRLSSLIRDHDALADARRRARSIRAKAHQLRSERALDAAYLAVGLATWNGAKGTQALDICAPVLLRRVSLVPRGHRLEDFEITLDDDLVVNPALTRFLRNTHDLDVPAEEWVALADRPGSFDPVPVLDRLRKLTGRVSSFTVTQRLVVSTFADIAGPFRDERLPHDNPMLTALAYTESIARDAAAARGAANLTAGKIDGNDAAAERAKRTPASAGRPSPLPDRDPARELLVLDADGDQQEVIDAAIGGESLCVETPPGTGATQLAVNLAANLAYEGKRVLFVSENGDSLDDFIARCDEAGLTDFAFDARELKKTRQRSMIRKITANERAVKPDTDKVFDALRGFRSELSAHTDALHLEREPWGVSAHGAMEHLARLTSARPAPATTVRLTPELLKSPSGRRERLERDLERLSSLGAFTLGVEDTAWFGAYLPTDDAAASAHEIVNRITSESLPDLLSRMPELAEKADLKPARTVAHWREQLTVLLEIRQTLDRMSPEVFEQPLDDMIAATGTTDYRAKIGSDIGTMARRRLKKLAREFVRPGAIVDDLHRALINVRDQRVRWGRLARHDGMPRVPRGLVDVNEKFSSLWDDLQELNPVMETTPDGAGLERMQLGELQARLEALSDDDDALTDLPERTELDGTLRAAGLGELVADLRQRKVSHDLVAQEFELAWWASVLQAMAADDPAVGGHDGDHMRRVAADFRIADRRHIDMGSERVRWALASGWKTAISTYPDQAGVLRDALRSQTADVGPLVRRAPDVVGALAPVWVMSVLQVPAVLPTGQFFDAVIIADSARVSTPEAAPAIARAHQVIAFGDEKLLGPSTFVVGADRRFGPFGEKADGTDASVFASLGEVLPRYRLHTSYRTCPAGLARFVNEHFYDSTISSLPFARSGDGSGLEFAYVADGTGMPDPASDQVESVDAEVDRVVRLVLDHARNRPRQTLAVVTISPLHAQRVSEAIQRALVDYPYVASFFSERAHEPFVVLDSEHLYGTTRDAVIFSLGYGRTAHGRVLHRMGPLSSRGGEKYLAAAITRARRRLTVVSCFTAADLDESKLHHGASLLPNFLSEVAKGSQSADPLDSGQDLLAATAESDPLLADISERLLRRGLFGQVNYAGEIDLAVANLQADDSGMLVAVESDGTRYAGTASIRERERIREEQLSRRGWHYVRVWSTDVFADPQAETDRIFDTWKAAVEELSPQAVLGAARAAAEVFRRKGDRPNVAPGLPLPTYREVDLDAMLDWIRSDGVERANDDLREMLRIALAQKRRTDEGEKILTEAVRRLREREAEAKAGAAAAAQASVKADDVVNGETGSAGGGAAPDGATADDSTGGTDAEGVAADGADGAGDSTGRSDDDGGAVSDESSGRTVDDGPTETQAEVKKTRPDVEPVLPKLAREDENQGWGDSGDSNDERLLRERPPHW